MKTRKKESFGVGEFTVRCDVGKVELKIHKDVVVARSDKDVYNELFLTCVNILGGRIDR